MRAVTRESDVQTVLGASGSEEDGEWKKLPPPSDSSSATVLLASSLSSSHSSLVLQSQRQAEDNGSPSKASSAQQNIASAKDITKAIDLNGAEDLRRDDYPDVREDVLFWLCTLATVVFPIVAFILAWYSPWPSSFSDGAESAMYQSLDAARNIGAPPQSTLASAAPLVPLQHETAEQDAVVAVPLWRLLMLTTPACAYCFMMATQLVFVLPHEAKWLFPQSSSVALGALIAISAAAGLVGPPVGRMIDQSRNRLGQRIPVLACASVFICASYMWMWRISQQMEGAAFFVIISFQMVAWGVNHTAMQGLALNVVPQPQISLVSGLMAVQCGIGSVLGLISVRYFAAFHFHVQYAAISTVLLISGFLVCASVSEGGSSPTTQSHATLPHEETVKSCDGGGSLAFDWRLHWNFTLLMGNKVLYYAVTTAKGFLLFFIRDTYRFKDQAELHRAMTWFCLCSECCTVLSALLFSALAKNSVIVNPKLAAMVGIAGKGFGWLLLVLVGALGLPIAAVDLAAVHYGFFHGIFLAAEQALTLKTVPDKTRSSYFLGFTCISSVIGGALMGLVGGAIVYLFGSTLASGFQYEVPPEGYAISGYIGLGALAAALCFTDVVVISRIHVKDDGAEGVMTSSMVFGAHDSLGVKSVDVSFDPVRCRM